MEVLQEDRIMYRACLLYTSLIDKGYFVKDVNTAISHRQAKHRGAMYRKSDSAVSYTHLFQLEPASI